MRFPEHCASSSSPLLAAVFAAILVLPACAIHTSKNSEGEDKKVDIQTPLGGIHVSEDAESRDLGLPVYPGAKEKPKDSSGDSKNANVNISGPGFALRVVAIEFLSDDPPQKIVDYYKDQLKKYGAVLECRTSEHSGHVVVNPRRSKDGSKELTCDKNSDGKTVELKAGVESNQHIVAVEPEGNGSTFALVFVRTRGREATI